MQYVFEYFIHVIVAATTATATADDDDNDDDYNGMAYKE